MKSKAETFVGFCIKSGKFKIGENACKTIKKAELMIICFSASDNAKKDMLSLSKKLGCKAVYPKEKTLEELTHKPNAKVMAITDKSLATAIAEQAKDEFITAEQEK